MKCDSPYWFCSPERLEACVFDQMTEHGIDDMNMLGSKQGSLYYCLREFIYVCNYECLKHYVKEKVMSEDVL